MKEILKNFYFIFWINLQFIDSQGSYLNSKF